MRFLRQSLLSTTALVALSLGLATGGPAQAANLTISAPAPGQSLTPSGVVTVDLLIVGNLANETGTLNIGPGVSVTSAFGTIIGNNHGSTGTVVVSGAGATFNDADYLKIGYFGDGSLTYENGASGNISGTAYIGDIETLGPPIKAGSGLLSVDGAGTTLRLQQGLYLNSAGDDTAQLRVTNGGVVAVNLGLYTDGSSSISVTGSGSTLKVGARDDDDPTTWDNTDGWIYMTRGSIVVADGALVDSDGSYIGGSETDLVTATITGAGTRWINRLPFYVGGDGHDPNGQNGNGAVIISDGAYVSAYTGAVGIDKYSTGVMTITGAGSTFEVKANSYKLGYMTIGSTGTGIVTVSDGGLLKAAHEIDVATYGHNEEGLDDEEQSKGTLNIGAAEGHEAAAAGFVDGGLNGIYFGHGDATLVFNHTSDDYEFDQTMFGSGATIKQLAGTTRLTGDSSLLDGTISVTGGKLYANGFLNGTSIDVRDGGFFGGTGYVKDVVVGDGGVFSPGDTFGTITLNGNLQIADGGTIQVDLGPDGSDLVHLQTGFQTVTIEDGALLDVRLTAGLDLSQSYKIIQADDGNVIKTAGFTVDDHAPLLETLVTYNPDSVVLHVSEAEIDWGDTVETDNQKATAAAVQALGSGNDVYDEALFLTDETIGRGFDLLSGEVHASTKSVLTGDTRLLRDLSTDHLQAAETNGGAMGYTSTETMAWVSPDAGLGPTSQMWLEAYGSLFSSDGNGNAGAVEAKSGGMIAGIDNDLGAMQVGALVGYSHSAIDESDRASTADVDTGHVGVYAGTVLDGFKVRGGGALSWNAISTSRTTILPDEVLTASYGALTAQAFAELGYALDFDGVTIEPFGQLAAVGLSTEAYSETGGPSALSADASFDAIGFATIGLRSTSVVVSADGQMKLAGQLAWQHAFGDTSPTAVQSFAGGDSFSVSGTPLATDTLLAQVGITRTITDNASLGVSYDGEFAEGASRHQLSGRFEVKF